MPSRPLDTLQKAWFEHFNEVPGARTRGPTVISICKNEEKLLPAFLRHYRSIGVRHFIIVDNNSSDSSPQYLKNQEDVTLLSASGGFRRFRGTWRQLIADTCADGEWVLLVDIDEWFWVPELRETTISDYCSSLDNKKLEGCPAVMIEPYCLEGGYDIDEFHNLLEAEKILVDSSSYSFVAFSWRTQKKWPSPWFAVRGGPRDRLSGQTRNRSLTQRILSHLFGLFCLMLGPRSSVGRKIVDKFPLNEKDLLPTEINVLKIPLIKWSQGLQIRGAPHQLSRRIRLTSDFAALIHHQFQSDWPDVMLSKLKYGDYVEGGLHYKKMLGSSFEPSRQPLSYRHSRRIRSLDELCKSGIRVPKWYGHL